MYGPRFKQKCAVCKKNMVVMYSARQFPICSECQMKQINKPVTDPKYKELFDIDLKLYEMSTFLRNIKQSYLRYDSLTERQVEAFKKAVEDLKKPREKKEEKPIEIEISSDISMRAKRLAVKAARDAKKKAKDAEKKE